MSVQLDIVAMPLVELLSVCLCDALTGTVAGPVCQCYLYPGSVTTADFCGVSGNAEGSATIGISRIYPASPRFPNQAFDVKQCFDNLWAVELVMTVYRCAATGKDGQPPTAAQRRADLEKILDDAAAMRRALCCLRDDPTIDSAYVLPGEWRPIDPAGACVGGQMSVTIAATDCCPPPIVVP